MRTAMTEKVLARDDMRSAIEASIPAGRAADPAEVATIIAFMLSNRTTFLTGQDVTIDGGGALMAYVGNTDVARMWSRRDRRGE
jgi:NAD(P)-dependent dehydrogenase (short-subunit alcohol dehydrogenase family)